MRNLTRNNDRWFERITAAVLPGCVARHMPDWSKVQAVSSDTPTELQLYKEEAPRESRKIKGRFLSATGDSVTLKLKDGQVETFQRKTIRKLLSRVPVAER